MCDCEMSTVLTLSQNAEPNVGHEPFFTCFFQQPPNFAVIPITPEAAILNNPRFHSFHPKYLNNTNVDKLIHVCTCILQLCTALLGFSLLICLHSYRDAASKTPISSSIQTRKKTTSMCLNKHHIIKMCGLVELQLHIS